MNGRPVDIAIAFKAAIPPPNSSVMATAPSKLAQNIRWITGALVFPPAAIVSITSDPESDEVMKNTSTSTIPMNDVIAVKGSCAANILTKLPKSMQPTVKADLREIWQAETRAAAGVAMDTFAEKYGAKYEKAVTCLTKDRDALLAFYDFPAEHSHDHSQTFFQGDLTGGPGTNRMDVQGRGWN